MQLKRSLVAGQSDDTTDAEQISTYSTDVISDTQTNIGIVQNVRLIWLDQNIDENNADCRNTIRQLRYIVNSVNTFTNDDQCIQLLEDMSNEKVCMLISGLLGQHIVPRVHNISQVDSIFIFCDNKEYHEQWVHEWSKIKGVFTEILPICEALKQAAKECEQNAISISFLPTGDNLTKKFDQLEPNFMYIQIMKEILLNINFQEEHMQQYLDYCRNVFAKNDRELRNINKFERKYREESPIWWYTYECFLYPMVNRALRMTDVDIMIKTGFFIKDLHRHIEQLHNEQFIGAPFNTEFTVYRGQGMSQIEFEQMTKTNGGLIAFNNFLSTSKKQSVSLRFVNRALTNPELMGVIFIITIDPSQSTTPFAAIKEVSAIKNEDEVIFAMQTVFRIGNITSMGGNPRLFEVELTLTSNNDKELRELTDYIREETFIHMEGWYRLSLVLFKMGQFQKCEEVCQILLEQTINESDKASIYNQLGIAKENQGRYKEAITFYEIAVELYKKNLPSNNINLAASYNNISMLYYNMGEYSKALLYSEKSLEIKRQSLPPDHIDLAVSYNNIGNVYSNMSECSKALSYYEKSLEIKQQSLPSNHPSLAQTYMNIGNMYNDMGEYSKALSSHEKSLEIKQQSLLPNHSDLAAAYNNIGVMYDAMGEHSKALSYYEKSFDIQQQLLSPNHPNLASSCGNIGLLYEDMGNYSKALSFFERSFEIVQHSLPTNHPILKQHQNNLERIKNKL